MSTAYAGDPLAGFPTTIPIPSDGDLKNAATVGAALEGLMDGVVALALIHTGDNPAGTFKNATLKGNTTIRNNGSDRTVSVVNTAWTFDNQSSITLSGTAAASPTVTITRHVNWPAGNHTFGGAESQTVSFACPMFFSQPIESSGAGRIRQRKVYMASGDANKSISINAADIHTLRAGELATTRRAILADGVDGVASTDMLRLVTQDNTNFLDVYAADGVTVIQDFNNSNIRLKAGATGAGIYPAVLLAWNGGFWEMVGQ